MVYYTSAVAFGNKWKERERMKDNEGETCSFFASIKSYKGVVQMA
jgi:hypothetical protein